MIKLRSGLNAALHASGGLGYHYLALRYQHSLWKPFRQNVRQWLEDWLSQKQDMKSLLLVGPSAGYCLPLDILKTMPRLLAIEPDPLARLFLSKKIDLGFVYPANIFKLDKGNKLTNFKLLLDGHPDAAILFCNVLGQLHVIARSEMSESKKPAFCNEFCSALQNRNWASFHDLASARTLPRLKSTKFSWDLGGGHDLREVFAIDTIDQEILPVTDHETIWLSLGRQTKLGVWQLTPRNEHLVAFVTGK